MGGDPVYSHIDYQGEPNIPLYVYITGVNGEISPFPHHPSNAKNTDSRLLSNFVNLPYDVRLEIYNHCNGPTLFHFMHTTSAIRRETEPLFWAHTDPWYYTEPRWLIEERGYAGAQFHCPEFASKIQQIEIMLYHLDASFRHDSSDNGPTVEAIDSPEYLEKEYHALTVKQQAR